MNVVSKDYHFSLTGSEISVLKRVLNIALCLSHPDNDSERDDLITRLCELFSNEKGHCFDAYHFVTDFYSML